MLYGMHYRAFISFAMRMCSRICLLTRYDWISWALASRLGWVALIFFIVGTSTAQEVSFTPRYDGISSEAGRPNVPKRSKPNQTEEADAASAPQLHSLGRFNGLFQEMCQLLELEQRRERIQRIAKNASDDEQECPSCRAFARQIAQSCATKPRMKKSTKGKSPEGQTVNLASATPLNDAKAGERLLKRYPRTDLVDVLSRLSEGLHGESPGQGPAFMALKSFEQRLFSVPDLTPGERDYYGIVVAYLYSAWAGRPGSPLEIATPSPEEVAELFKR